MQNVEIERLGVQECKEEVAKRNEVVQTKRKKRKRPNQYPRWLVKIGEGVDL